MTPKDLYMAIELLEKEGLGEVAITMLFLHGNDKTIANATEQFLLEIGLEKIEREGLDTVFGQYLSILSEEMDRDIE